MQLTEAKAVEIALPALAQWLVDEHELEGYLSCCEKVTVEGKRADALIVGMDEDGATITLSVEAKSSKTLRQILTRYNAQTHVSESILLGGLALLLHPVAALIAFGANHLLGRAAHLDSDAALQAISYPGDLRILLLPADVLDDFPEAEDDLCKLCDRLGLGLVTVTSTGEIEWLCEPEPIDEEDEWAGDEEWLDQYKTGSRIREELAEYLGIELDEDDEDDDDLW